MSGQERGQVGATAAEVYEQFFLPAIFSQWADRLLDAAAVSEADYLLDVGCGTGVVARRAVDRVGPQGRVVGVDPNGGMLAVARRHPGVDWRQGWAEELPVESSEFDVVVSQFAIMFFEDRPRAIEEMARVLRPRGRLAVATWADVVESPGYAAMVELFDELYGEGGSAALRAPFTMGDPGELAELATAEFDDVDVTLQEGTARFDSVEAWVHTDIKGWTMSEMSEADYQMLLDASKKRLARFENEDGTISFRMPALVVTGSKPDQ